MRPLLVGIAGGSGSGKSRLADRVVTLLGPDRALHLTHDAYYRPAPPDLRDPPAARNYDVPEALDTDLLHEHLLALRAGLPVEVPVYAFDLHDRIGTTPVFPRPVVVVEGILLFAHPDVRDLFDLRVYVEAPDEVRFERRLARDVAERGRTPEDVRRQWTEQVLPAHHRFVEPTREHVHLVVDGREDVDTNAHLVLRALQDRVGSDLAGRCAAMVEPGAPGQVPKEKGIPKDKGVPRERAILPGQGRPRSEGRPKSEAILPGTPGHKLKGAPGQIDRGAEGQLDKDAPNPWAPGPDTVQVDPADLVLPPSRPRDDADR